MVGIAFVVVDFINYPWTSVIVQNDSGVTFW